METVPAFNLYSLDFTNWVTVADPVIPTDPLICLLIVSAYDDVIAYDAVVAKDALSTEPVLSVTEKLSLLPFVKVRIFPATDAVNKFLFAYDAVVANDALSAIILLPLMYDADNANPAKSA